MEKYSSITEIKEELEQTLDAAAKMHPSTEQVIASLFAPYPEIDMVDFAAWKIEEAEIIAKYQKIADDFRAANPTLPHD